MRSNTSTKFNSITPHTSPENKSKRILKLCVPFDSESVDVCEESPVNTEENIEIDHKQETKNFLPKAAENSGMDDSDDSLLLDPTEQEFPNPSSNLRRTTPFSRMRADLKEKKKNIQQIESVDMNAADISITGSKLKMDPTDQDLFSDDSSLTSLEDFKFCFDSDEEFAGRRRVLSSPRSSKLKAVPSLSNPFKRAKVMNEENEDPEIMRDLYLIRTAM